MCRRYRPFSKGVPFFPGITQSQLRISCDPSPSTLGFATNPCELKKDFSSVRITVGCAVSQKVFTKVAKRMRGEQKGVRVRTCGWSFLHIFRSSWSLPLAMPMASDLAATNISSLSMEETLLSLSMPPSPLRLLPHATLADGRVRILTKRGPIGKGAFGAVYEAVHTRTKERFAVKVEHAPQDVNSSRSKRGLAREADVYRKLKNVGGFPRMRYFGKIDQHENHVALVLDLCGPSLADVHKAAGSSLPVDPLRNVAAEILQRLESIHELGLIYGDAKPGNFLLPWRTASTRDAVSAVDQLGECPVMCCDFGYTYKQHLTKDRRSLWGTASYASVRNHEHVLLGPADDLEAVAYMLVFLHKGKLPWTFRRRRQGKKETTAEKKERFERMLELKLVVELDELCGGMPFEFVQFVEECRRMSAMDIPQYSDLRRLLLGGGGSPRDSGDLERLRGSES